MSENNLIQLSQWVENLVEWSKRHDIPMRYVHLMSQESDGVTEMVVSAAGMDFIESTGAEITYQVSRISKHYVDAIAYVDGVRMINTMAKRIPAKRCPSCNHEMQEAAT